ncbi:protein of unknown function [Taphrina deformans PYCC 5710]|uniref:Structure-specific endonuclease subunit SLX4 n=1 Tax=Taphrina deformans (strain PYCC 5710 / ATCC 11124 / CBS 356.35 / IMI 108563 / JCM 9778 / NBRC 8474) TaxID=1097556 RepID=R4XFJ9_TAPDE|nr:protein of unknown function [Taphrina deformans PYCC 5710]|eukprot:CCG84453.1 protein of unknown function [Taphrina deformans PYCC 5710]
MSVQARAADVIEITDNESPRQNNKHNNDTSHAIDDSLASVQLPDLTEILAGFNTRNSTEATLPEQETDEVRAFGKTISQFNFAQSDLNITKLNGKAPRKPRIPKAPKEPKPSKEKVARAPKVKRTPKKPVTVTERAIAPFLSRQAHDDVQTGTPSILEFLSPGRYDKATAAPSAKLSKRKKAQVKDDELPKLSTPKTARKKHRDQNLVYPETPCSQPKDSMNILNPSKLISLSKGHFSAGNRCPEGRLTDGGPREITSNQEGLRHPDDDDQLLDLTCLPWRICDANSLQTDNPGLEETMDLVDKLDNDSDVDTDPRDLQTYLDELVEVTDAEASDNDAFPVMLSKAPANVRSETMDSLRSLLSEPVLIEKLDTPSAIGSPRLETSIKRMRKLSNVPKRIVSPKLKTDSSPKTAQILQIHSDSSPHTVPDQEQVVPTPNKETDISVISEKTTYILSSSPPLIADTPDDDAAAAVQTGKLDALPRISSPTMSFRINESAEKVTRPRGRPRKHHPIETHAQKLDTRPSEASSSKIPLVIKEGDLTMSSSTKTSASRQKPSTIEQNKDYWIVPDSEDDESFQSGVPSTNVSPAKPATTTKAAPDFKDYTTLQLQTELSRFGFKVSKNRAGMVDLLHKCWLAKQEQAVKEQGSAPTTTARTGNGSPGKSGAGIEPLPDSPVLDLTSADGLVPPTRVPSSTVKESREQRQARVAEEKMARARARTVKAEQKAAQKVAEAEARRVQKLALREATEASRAVEVQTLCRNLTALLRSGDGHVWWIRILKYEPIVLEDFVEWLRDARGIVTEVDTVRDYFDGKGVCCVRRITRSGKGRKRF